MEYDSRGTRVRKHFDDGLDPAARSFFASKSRAGKNPKLIRADGRPPHVPLPEPPPHLFVQYDGTKVIKGVRRRVLKKFADGLTRAAKEYFQAKAREGKHPQFLAADLSPLFGRGSRYRRPEPDPTHFERELTQSALFDTGPDQLPD
uniref:Putative serine/threonine protein kinase n=1 Tax=Gemmata sp. Wa1-1 TaxID=235140 RepID=Q5EUJ3_9BACT|nr:putative serine/threonine protein kinase [Gemmata sp. Wa1-1]